MKTLEKISAGRANAQAIAAQPASAMLEKNQISN
jgi:hypothetical protein